MLIAIILQYNGFYDTRNYEFLRKITNGNLSSLIKFGWWKMFAKSQLYTYNERILNINIVVFSVKLYLLSFNMSVYIHLSVEKFKNYATDLLAKRKVLRF